MDWDEVIYKLNNLKIQRDRELDQYNPQQQQRIQNYFGVEGYNKQDFFQDKQNPYNYNVPFERGDINHNNHNNNDGNDNDDYEISESDNHIDNLEAQLENDTDEDDANDEDNNNNIDYKQNQNDEIVQNNIRQDNNNECKQQQYNQMDQRQLKQKQTIDRNQNQQQQQLFQDQNDKENEYYQSDFYKKGQYSKIIKNTDYFPPTNNNNINNNINNNNKHPLEQIPFSNQFNININQSNSQLQQQHQSQQLQQQSYDNLNKMSNKQLNPHNKDQLNINMINTYTTLGTGSFGRVKLAKFKSNDKDVFALKMMKKIEIVKLKQVDHIKSEKKILSNIKHPFLVELKGAFQDECYIYMLFEFVSGGEIFSRLRKEGRFNLDISLFYISEIYLALQYLHNQNIVYRDLKPENLLIDKDGHVKIADFGFAKVMDSNRTYTLCGTPEYLAPEIIQGAKTGYGKTVDWWALGVLIFEMLSGHPPFYDNDPMGIYQKIVKSVIQFPHFFSLRSKDLIRKLLNPNIHARLGCVDDGASIRDHKWFKGVNWEKVYTKQIPSPWTPHLKTMDDVSCFEKYPESQDELENPSHDIQKLFVDF